MYVTAGFGRRGRPLGTEGKIAWFLVASAVPAGIAGVVLKDQIADFDRIWMIAVMLIVFGLLLLVADRLPERKELEAFRLRDALAMGVGQALALQPGVSRSGATLTVSRFLGYERDAAARLVFLMSLPIIAGAGVFALADASIPSDFWPPFLWGMAASALTGYVAVWGTLKLVRSRTFAPFVVYRIVVGVAVLLILTRVGVDQPLSTGTTPACPDALTTSPTTSAGTATPRSASEAMTTSAPAVIRRPSTA